MRVQIQHTEQGQNQKDPLSFEGQVSKKLGRYFLSLSNHRDSSYRLDDDWKAKPFLGKIVRITGTLDENSATLHIRTISQIPDRPR